MPPSEESSAATRSRWTKLPGFSSRQYQSETHLAPIFFFLFFFPFIYIYIFFIFLFVFLFSILVSVLGRAAALLRQQISAGGQVGLINRERD